MTAGKPALIFTVGTKYWIIIKLEIQFTSNKEAIRVYQRTLIYRFFVQLNYSFIFQMSNPV